MKSERKESHHETPIAARVGARTGAVATGLYALGFLLYVTGRLVVEIVNAETGNAPLIPMLGAIILSVVVAVIAASWVAAAVSIVLGAISTSMIQGLLARISATGGHPRPRAIAGGVAIAVIAVGQLMILPWIGLSPFELPFETWLFWFGLPAVAYLVASIRMAIPAAHATVVRDG